MRRKMMLWRRFIDENLHNFYSSPCIIKKSEIGEEYRRHIMNSIFSGQSRDTRFCGHTYQLFKRKFLFYN